jgi:hypothetical protein
VARPPRRAGHTSSPFGLNIINLKCHQLKLIPPLTVRSE